jgi:hypothetical protein
MPSCCSLPVNPDDELAVALPPAFAQRLRELYGLKRSPKDLNELITLRREAGRVWLLSSAELLVSSTPTRHVVWLKGKRLYVHCALDALMYPLITGQDAEIQSRCPICDQLLGAAVRKGEIVSWAPQGAVLWLGVSAQHEACGTSASDFNTIRECVCPFINLFDFEEHLKSWQAKNAQVLGVKLSLPEAFALAKGLCRSAEEEASTSSQA